VFEQIKAYCDANGIPYQLRTGGLRVMDVTQLPGALKGAVDDGGFVAADSAVSDDEAAPAAKAKKGSKS
jgi:hypothetical protein